MNKGMNMNNLKSNIFIKAETLDIIVSNPTLCEGKKPEAHRSKVTELVRSLDSTIRVKRPMV